MTLTEKQKSNWKESLPKLIYAYNSTRCEVNGFSPFYLLFGRSQRLPVDLMFGLTPETGTADKQEYMRRWKRQMQEAYDITAGNAKKCAERSKRNYDSKVRSSVLHEGDRVLVRNLTPRGGTGKLRSHWEECIHKVIRQMGKDMPIYEVLPELGKGRGSRILHRNLLLPCDHLPLETQLKPETSKRKTTAQTSRDKQEPHQEEEDDESDDDDCGYYQMPRIQPQPVMKPRVITDREDADRELTTPSQNVQHQSQDIPQPQEAQDRGVVLDEEETLGQGEQVQEEFALGEEIQAPPSPVPSESNREVETGCQRPVRERRPPRIFTYNQLGNPVCNSVGPQSNFRYWCPPGSFRAIQGIALNVEYVDGPSAAV